MHRVRALPVVLLVAVAAPALAQTGLLGTNDPSRGVTLTPGSVALTDEPTAITYNPAGLRAQGSMSLILVHERSASRRHDANGVFLGGAIGDALGLGVAIESVRPFSSPHQGKLSFGLALGGEPFSVGLSANTFNAGTVGGLSTFDVGLQSRPWRWLSFGALARSVNAPRNATAAIGRSYLVGIGFRPLTERVSLAVDWVVSEQAPLNASRLQYTAQVRPINGLTVLLGLSHTFNGVSPIAVQGGLAIDLDHFGYTQGVGAVGPDFDWQFMARASLDKYPSIISNKGIAVLSLEGLGTASAGSTLGQLLGVEAEDRYLRVLKMLDQAARDDSLAAVVVKLESSSLGLARADELRTALMRLKAKGKKVIGYALTMSDNEYLVATACDQLFAAPEAMLMIDGLRSSLQFFGGAAEKLGVTIDVARVGEFKTFPEQFTRTSMSEAQRTTITAYMETMAKTMEERVVEGRKIEPEVWRRIIQEGLKPSARAKELRQIDDAVTPQQLDEALGSLVPGARVVRNYRPFDTRDTRWGPRPQIAVIPVLGSISGGNNQTTPLAQVAGAQTFIETLNQAAEDPDVRAIVIRVDSGGGDALASDLMYRAVLSAKKRKPVIASMGDVAASGGYYVAMGADHIVASPTTLTGSIGIFFAKPAVKELAQSLGITQETLTQSPRSGLTDFYEPWTPEQRAVAQAWVDSGYKTFITEVASSRKLSVEAVDAVARGRVWSGADAKARGLVDELGGLLDAIAVAKARSKSPDVEVSIWQPRGGLLGSVLNAVAPSMLELQVGPLPGPVSLDPWAKQLGAFWWLTGEPRLQARLEFVLDVR